MSHKKKAIVEAVIGFAIMVLFSIVWSALLDPPASTITGFVFGMAVGAVWVMRNGPGTEYR